MMCETFRDNLNNALERVRKDLIDYANLNRSSKKGEYNR